MLSLLKPQRLAKVIFKFNNEGILRFKQFIEYRYFPEKSYSNKSIEEKQRKEKDFLENLATLYTLKKMKK
jgi:hypothetical protein